MKKSKAIIILLVTVILIGLIGYADVYGPKGYGDGSVKDINLGLDLRGGVSITYQVVGDENPDSEDMSDTIAKLQKRVENYSTEASVYPEGNNRINIEIPGVSDATDVLRELGRPGALYFIAQTDADGNQNYYATDSYNAEGKPEYQLTKSIDELKAAGSIVLEGTDVADARAVSTQDQITKTNEYVVSLSMTDDGKQKFADATTKALASGESIAIYYDGSLVSVPRVQAAITDGQAQITGMNSFEEAESLASTIRIGGLKLELEELHSKVVGAQLGEEAIETSLKAAAIGLIIVAVFMIAVYFVPGFAAVLALCLYVVLIVLLLAGFNDIITLTLPGVAGIILSIGMAVDANVIIFARIREELATGKSVDTAMNIGYEKALSAIIDGNVTTLIAAVVLMLFGPGPVKGFAQTLALGIVLSMVTALFVTKWIMKALYTLGFKSEKWYGVTKNKKAIDFLSKRAVFFVISIAAIVSGFVAMGMNSSKGNDVLNYSLEFVGGTAYTVNFNENRTLQDLTVDVVPKIEDITGSAVQVQTVQDSNEVIFKTSELDNDTRDALESMFENDYSIDKANITSETIGSTISSEMKTSTITAVIVAVICMLIYILVRFSDIRFGISSVACLMHDVLVVLAFYAIARVSVGNTFIACMLTIVGYSINATIVIFDRVRENMKGSRKNADELKEIVNNSITQTLSRSLFTSLTTFIMVAVLYVFGVTSIKDFALPLMVGIICGCYSSVCLAGALWYTLRIKFAPKK